MLTNVSIIIFYFSPSLLLHGYLLNRGESVVLYIWCKVQEEMCLCAYVYTFLKISVYLWEHVLVYKFLFLEFPYAKFWKQLDFKLKLLLLCYIHWLMNGQTCSMSYTSIHQEYIDWSWPRSHLWNQKSPHVIFLHLLSTLSFSPCWVDMLWIKRKICFLEPDRFDSLPLRSPVPLHV